LEHVQKDEHLVQATDETEYGAMLSLTLSKVTTQRRDSLCLSTMSRRRMGRRDKVPYILNHGTIRKFVLSYAQQ